MKKLIGCREDFLDYLAGILCSDELILSEVEVGWRLFMVIVLSRELVDLLVVRKLFDVFVVIGW